MNITHNTILITGGTSGIGWALAEEFVHLGNEVIICGRREDRLKEAKSKWPSIHYMVCDIAIKEEREKLFHWVNANFPKLNILINNAGIQRAVNLAEGDKQYNDWHDELETNITGPIHLSTLFIPELAKQKDAVIANVSSGLAFVPLATVPVYSASKAAIHSFTMSLRHQLKKTGIKVFEIIPPIVATELQGERAKFVKDRAIPAKTMAEAIVEGLRNDKYEITAGDAENLVRERDSYFERMNAW